MKNVLALAAAIILISATAFGAGGDMGGGTGTEANPYLIEDMADFDEFADPNNYYPYRETGAHVKLACDPNLAGTTYTKAVIDVFYGIFDGDGHTISNFTIKPDETDYNPSIGLFGWLGHAPGILIKNLGVVNCNIIGGVSSIGGLCGANGHGTIINCYSTGSINGGYIAGGLCGNNGGTIIDCHSDFSITGEYMLGGICGANQGIITDCYATGSVSGSEFIGGLCGKNFGPIDNSYSTGTVTGNSILGGLSGNNLGSITNCYSTGSTNGGDRAGGLCGINEQEINNCYASGAVDGGFQIGGLCGLNNWNSTITNCYATGSVKGDDFFGGFCGANGYGIITNCYATGLVSGDNAPGAGFCGGPETERIFNSFWNTGTSGVSDPEGGLAGTDTDGMIGVTIIEMRAKSTFSTWDFANDPCDRTDDLWDICDGAIYPRLVWEIAGGDYLCPEGVSFEDLGFFAVHWLETEYGTVEGAELSGDGFVGVEDLIALSEYWLTFGCGDCDGRDLTGDGNVDMADVAYLGQRWNLSEYGNCGGAELTGDGKVDLRDFAVFAQSWMLDSQ